VVSLVRARPVAATVQRFAAVAATFGASVTTAIIHGSVDVMLMRAC
jgi:hypothetical protein